MKHSSYQNIARVLSFNIRVGVDSSLARVASDLYKLKADLSAFQEIAAHWSLGQSVDQLSYLTSAQGHVNDMFMPLLQRAWALDPYQGGPFDFESFLATSPSFLYEALTHNYGYYGIAMSALGTFDDQTHLYLPYSSDEQRGAQICSWTHGNMSQPLTVLNTHLSVNESERYAQVESIIDALKHQVGPLLLLGDFNDTTQSPLIQSLQARLRLDNLASGFALENDFSFSVKKPSRRIDHILGRGLKVHGFGLAQAVRSSDHFPIWADISW